jgi:hypothetical protein
MSGTIIVIVMGVCAVAAGIWGWWYERHGSDDE